MLSIRSNRLSSTIAFGGKTALATAFFLCALQGAAHAIADCKNQSFSFNKVNWTSVSPIRVMAKTVYKGSGSSGGGSSTGTAGSTSTGGGTAGGGQQPAWGGGSSMGTGQSGVKTQTKEDNVGNSPGKYYSQNATCECPWVLPPYVRYGFEFEMWEPAMWDDITKKEGCATLFGANFGGSNYFKSGSVSSADSGTGSSTETYYNAMHWKFLPFQILGVLVDLACLEPDSFDLAYMSQWDSGWSSDLKSLWMFPEVALFAISPTGPQALMVSNIASAIIATVGAAPQDILFPVMGTQGFVYPPTGTTAEPNSVMAAAGDSHKLRFKMAREGLLCDMGLWDCFCVPTPILMQSNYRLAEVYPYQSMKAMYIGSPDWQGMGKNPPLGTGGGMGPTGGGSQFSHEDDVMNGMDSDLAQDLNGSGGDASGLGGAKNSPDNFGFLVWRYHRCCVL